MLREYLDDIHVSATLYFTHSVIPNRIALFLDLFFTLMGVFT